MPTQFAFFQQAMLALLGSKDISEGLVHIFEFLHSRFGLSGLTFDRFSSQEKILKIQYVVSQNGFSVADLELHLSEEEAAYLRNNEETLAFHLGASLQCNSVSQGYWQLLKPYMPMNDRGYMVGIMQVDGRVIGHLVCHGQSVNCFTDEHVRYFCMILPAFSLAFSNMLDMGEVYRQNALMRHEQGRLKRELGVLTDDDMVGAQSGLRHVVEEVRQLAHSDTPVLILGETGTGKELVADAIQKYSPRSHNPFIKINCGALSDTLLDSELFGHEKGAFTGALSSHQGRFEQADGGTLFLDEVGELSPQAQVRLLRVLQNGTFERIGGTRTLSADVRIIAATNRDLWALCQQGSFRTDLFHRLNVFPIVMPPLRQRREDIPILVRHFVEKIAKRQKISCPAVLMERLDRLMLYAWPGNVRELENLVERAMILANGGPINLDTVLPKAATMPHQQEDSLLHQQETSLFHQQLEAFWENKFAELMARIASAGASTALESSSACGQAAKPAAAQIPSLHPKDITTATICQALERCNGKVYGRGGAAELLGMNHSTLRSRIRRMGLHKPQPR